MRKLPPSLPNNPAKESVRVAQTRRIILRHYSIASPNKSR